MQSHKYNSISTAVHDLAINKAILARRVKNGKSRAEARHSEQILSKIQQDVLSYWIK